MSISISLTGQISVADASSGTISLQKQLSFVMPGLTFSQAQSLPIGTSATSIGLPIALIQFAYIKNLHAVNTVIVTWTPSGGASNVVLLLQPGSMIIFSETSPLPGSGITALSLQANVPNTPVEFILGG